MSVSGIHNTVSPNSRVLLFLIMIPYMKFSVEVLLW